MKVHFLIFTGMFLCSFLFPLGTVIAGDTAEESFLEIVLMGDIAFNDGIVDRIGSRGVGYPFGEIEPKIKGADLRIANLETPISERGTLEEGKYSPFRADPEVVGCLLDAGVDAVSLANNHCLDYGTEALNDTMEILEGAGIGSSGIWYGDRSVNSTEDRLLVLEAGTMKVGFLAYTEDVSSHWVGAEGRPGPMPLDMGLMEQDILWSNDRVDLLVVSIHWRKFPQYTTAPEPLDRTICRRLIDVGADVIMGHGPHTVHEVEGYKDGLIFYSLGNVAMKCREDLSDLSYIAKVKVENGNVASFELLPLKQGSYRYVPMGTPLDRSREAGFNVSYDEVMGMYEKDIYGIIDEETGVLDLIEVFTLGPWYLKVLMILLAMEILCLLTTIIYFRWGKKVTRSTRKRR